MTVVREKFECPRCHCQRLHGDEMKCKNCGLHFVIYDLLNDTNVSSVDHPAHYGGADNPYEAIKVIEAWQLGFNLGNALKYIARAGKKDDRKTDLQKALWYLQREISNL